MESSVDHGQVKSCGKLLSKMPHLHLNVQIQGSSENDSNFCTLEGFTWDLLWVCRKMDQVAGLKKQ